MLKIAINAVLFQVGWILSVLYGNGAAMLIAAIVIAIYSVFFLRSRADIVLIAAVVMLGVCGDLILGYYGVLVYPSGAPFPPFWMVTLWLLFATTLPWSLSWLVRNPLWFVLFAIIGGPVSYIAGVNLSSVSFGQEFALSVIILVVVWLIHGMIIQNFYKQWQLRQAS